MAHKIQRMVSKIKRKTLNSLPSYSIMQVWNLEHIKPKAPFKPIIQVRKPDDIFDWRVITDRVLGGFSNAEISFDPLNDHTMSKEDDYDDEFYNEDEINEPRTLNMSDYLNISAKDGSMQDPMHRYLGNMHRDDIIVDKKDFFSLKEEYIEGVGAIVFEGNISGKLPPSNKEVVRSGFACLKSGLLSPSLPLDGYDAISMKIRTCGKTYIFQMTPIVGASGDLYQVIIPPLKPDQWFVITIPLHLFKLTNRGYVEQTQMNQDNLGVKDFGFLMADPKEGPFNLAIDWIGAVNQKRAFQKVRYTAEF
eukprot:TRINITY_DN12104_c0_g1_i1.p1 TRINITY_DN12104_c0_g1~~TRINITY_DN12104_c0_g1_i1.p1  ORF type:complete len:306 (-),score=70.24 TRINITY_DN12104_c0_g1_i1:33-950(-)